MPLERLTWGNGRQNQHFGFAEKEPISVITETAGAQGLKFNAPSPEPEQASDLTLRSGTRPGSPLLVGVSGSDSFAIDPAPLRVMGVFGRVTYLTLKPLTLRVT
jgi:hypothetical protein